MAWQLHYNCKAMLNPKDLQPKAKPVSKPRQGGMFSHLRGVFGVAFLLATLFTAWTPGESPFEPLDFSSLAPVSSTSSPQAISPATPRSKPLIGIVAGHWKNDSGAVCTDGLREVDINLNIATLVQKLLVAEGIDVEILQEFDTKLTNYQASALVSIHADSCDFINNQATGFKVAAAMGTKYPELASRLTACLRSRYAESSKLPLHSMSVTPDMTSYHAFGEVNPFTPAAIIETGFMNLDRQFLTQTPEIAATGIARGVICFVRNESIATPSSLPTP